MILKSLKYWVWYWILEDLTKYQKAVSKQRLSVQEEKNKIKNENNQRRKGI